MKTVTAALGAALLKRAWKPAITVKVDNRRSAGIPVIEWTEMYDGSEVNISHCAFVACGDWLIDFRMSTAVGEIYVRRTEIDAAPDPGSSSWSKLSAGVRTDAQISACADGNNVWIFWVDTDKKTIKYRFSSDAGVTFAAAATAVTLVAGHKCNALAAVCPGEGLHDVVLLMADSASELYTSTDKDICWAYYTTAGGWSASDTWGRSPGQWCDGIAAVHHSCSASKTELTFVVTGEFEDLTKAYNMQTYHLAINSSHAATFTFTGTIWQGSVTNVRPRFPAIVGENDNDRARVVFQYYDGNLPAAKRWQSYFLYIHELSSGDDLTFGAWQPFRITGYEYALGLCRCGDYLIAGNNASMWTSPMYDGSDPWAVNVSADLVAFEHHVYDNALIEDLPVQPGYGYVFLDNHDGRYDGLGESGEWSEAIKRGAQVIIKAGYKTPTGNEDEILPPMWIDRIMQVCNPRSSASQEVPHLNVEGGPILGGRYVVLSLYDVWTLTTKRGPTDDYSSNAAPRDIFRYVFGNMGIAYSDDATARLGLGGGGYPQVTWVTLAGRPWYLMIRDLLRYVHCRIKFYTVYSESDGYPTARAYIFADRDVDPADLQVGASTELPLYAGLYTEQDRFGGYMWVWQAPPYSPSTATLMSGPFTGAALEADGVSEIEINYTETERLGYWQPRQVIDYQVTGSTYITPADRVGFAATDAVQPLYGGQILIPLHPCLELWDRLWVHDSRACWAEQKRFVVGIESYYDTRQGRAQYDQVVHLLRHVK